MPTDFAPPWYEWLGLLVIVLGGPNDRYKTCIQIRNPRLTLEDLGHSFVDTAGKTDCCGRASHSKMFLHHFPIAQISYKI